MNKSKRLIKAKALLSQAFNTLPDSQGVNEVKTYVKRAIEHIDKQTKREVKKTQTKTNHENWWDHIESGISNMAHSPMSSETQMKSLNVLNKMIEETQTEIDKLETEKYKSKKSTEDIDLFLQD